MSTVPLDPAPPASNVIHLEPRIAKLEAHAEHTLAETKEVRADLRDLTRKVDADVRTLTNKIDADVRMLTSKIDGDVRMLTSKIDTDVRMLARRMDRHFYIMLGAMTGLAGLMAKGFHWF